MVKVLLKKSLEVPCTHHSPDSWASSLEVACSMGHAAVVKHLLHWQGGKQPEGFGSAAAFRRLLHAARGRGDSNLVDALRSYKFYDSTRDADADVDAGDPVDEAVAVPADGSLA